MASFLLVGEGPSEIGTDVRDGFLRCLLEQLAEGDDGGLAETLDCAQWGPVNLPELHYRSAAQLAQVVVLPPPQPKGIVRVAARAIRAAQAMQCDALVVLVDNDHRPGRGDELADAFSGCLIVHVQSVAKEMLEAWLLADPEVLSPIVIALSKQPEDIWGDKHDGQSEYPKNVLKRGLQQANRVYYDVLDDWVAARAVRRAPVLRRFCAAIVTHLLNNPTFCRPKSWDE